VKDKEKRESKGFAFVTFTTKDAAQKAIEEIQDKEFKVIYFFILLVDYIAGFECNIFIYLYIYFFLLFFFRGKP